MRRAAGAGPGVPSSLGTAGLCQALVRQAEADLEGDDEPPNAVIPIDQSVLSGPSD
jgi:hypothetical protein